MPYKSLAQERYFNANKGAAGYMELRGAEKDADCKKVSVDGGVSTKLGCCNYFEPEKRSVQEFRCGLCEYVKDERKGKFFG